MKANYLFFLNMTKYAMAYLNLTHTPNRFTENLKIRIKVVFCLSTPVIKYAKYVQLRIRRIQKYEYAQPKYDSEKPKYAHIWLKLLSQLSN